MNYSTYTERTVNSKQRGRLNARTLLYASLMLALSGASVCLEAMDSKPLARAREDGGFSDRYNGSTECDVNGVRDGRSGRRRKDTSGGAEALLKEDITLATHSLKMVTSGSVSEGAWTKLLNAARSCIDAPSEWASIRDPFLAEVHKAQIIDLRDEDPRRSPSPSGGGVEAMRPGAGALSSPRGTTAAATSSAPLSFSQPAPGTDHGLQGQGGIKRSASIGTAGSSPTPAPPRPLPCPAPTVVRRPMLFAREAAAAPTPAIVATPVKVPAVPAPVWVPAVHLASWIFDPATIDDYNPAQAVSPALDYAHLKASQRGYFSSCDTTAAPGKGEGLLFEAIKAAAKSASALEKAKHYCVASIIVYAGMFALSAEEVFPSGTMVPFSKNCKAGEPLSSTTIRRDQVKARGALVHALSKSMDLARIVGVSSEPGVTQDSFRVEEKRALLEHVQLFFTGQKWNLREGSYNDKVHPEVIVDILQDESPDSIYYRLMVDAIIYRIFHLCNVLNGGGW